MIASGIQFIDFTIETRHTILFWRNLYFFQIHGAALKLSKVNNTKNNTSERKLVKKTNSTIIVNAFEA